MRSLDHTVQPQQSGLRLELILKRSFGLTAKQISQLKFLENGITVNGVRKRISYKVDTGDRIRITFSDANRRKSGVVPLHKSLRILYEDEDLIILDKLSGEVCHPTHGHYMDTLANQVSFYLSEAGEPASKVRCIGRLDKDTSGVLLFAKNRYSAHHLILQREKGVLYKEYLALVNGSFKKAELSGEICMPLAPAPGSLMKMEVSSAGKEARTVYRVLCSDKKCSLVQCRIYTGRTHQIRVHMAAAGHPLIGDPLYGHDISVSTFRTALHAWRIHLRQPATGEEITAESFHSMEMFC